MLRNLEGWHFVVLLVVILVLFGSKRMPDAARGLGRSLRIFKSEVKSMQDDDKPTTAAASPATAEPAELPPTTATDTTGRAGESAQREAPPRVDG